MLGPGISAQREGHVTDKASPSVARVVQPWVSDGQLSKLQHKSGFSGLKGGCCTLCPTSSSRLLPRAGSTTPHFFAKRGLPPSSAAAGGQFWPSLHCSRCPPCASSGHGCRKRGTLLPFATKIWILRDPDEVPRSEWLVPSCQQRCEHVATWCRWPRTPACSRSSPSLCPLHPAGMRRCWR